MFGISVFSLYSEICEVRTFFMRSTTIVTTNCELTWWKVQNSHRSSACRYYNVVDWSSGVSLFVCGYGYTVQRNKRKAPCSCLRHRSLLLMKVDSVTTCWRLIIKLSGLGRRPLPRGSRLLPVRYLRRWRATESLLGTLPCPYCTVTLCTSGAL